MTQKNSKNKAKAAITGRFIDAINYLLDADSELKKADIAKELDITSQIITEILGNRMYVSVDLVQKICEKYDINPFYILFNVEPIKEGYKAYIKNSKEYYNKEPSNTTFKEFVGSPNSPVKNKDDTPKSSSNAELKELLSKLTSNIISLSDRVERIERGSKND